MAIAQAILAGEKYTAIAGKQGMGLSTLKRRTRALFEYANVANALIFVSTYEGYTVELGTAEHSVSLVVDTRTLSASSLARPA